MTKHRSRTPDAKGVRIQIPLLVMEVNSKCIEKYFMEVRLNQVPGKLCILGNVTTSLLMKAYTKDKRGRQSVRHTATILRERSFFSLFEDFTKEEEFFVLFTDVSY